MTWHEPGGSLFRLCRSGRPLCDISPYYRLPAGESSRGLAMCGCALSLWPTGTEHVSGCSEACVREEKQGCHLRESMNLKRALTAVLVLFTISGCQPPPRIDASSEEALKASIEEVRRALPEEKRNRFDESIIILNFKDVDLKGKLLDKLAGRSVTDGNTKGPLHGKTADEVIAEANRILAERREKERKQARAEIEELEARRKRSQEDREQLERFEVLRSRFFKERVGFLGPQPFVELSVRNGTAQTVSRVHFIGTLASPDRSIPWLRERFSYRVEDNLEPGQDGTWRMPMNPFSAWGTTDVPEDVVLTVEVDELEGPKAKTLYSRRGFGEADARRLTLLKEQYEL